MRVPGDPASRPAGPRSLMGLGRWACGAGAAFGGLGLLGWLLHAPRLTTLVSDEPAMSPNTAVALVMVGIAAANGRRDRVGGLRRKVSVILGVVAVAIGLMTLYQRIFAVDLNVDGLVLRGLGVATPAVSPSPPTALALMFLGLGVVLFEVVLHRVRPSEWLASAAAAIAFTAHQTCESPMARAGRAKEASRMASA